MVRTKKQKKEKKRENLYFVFAMIIIVAGSLFIFQMSKKIVKEKEEIFTVNLNQYKEATFSDSFSGDGWIDTEKTTLTFKKDEMIFIYPLEANLMASLSEPSEMEEQVRQLVSLKINFAVREVVAAQITGSDSKMSNGRIKYYFSNDGGLIWETAEIGQIMYFKNSGNELKWKAEIGPLDQKGGLSPAGSSISSIYLKYWYTR